MTPEQQAEINATSERVAKALERAGGKHFVSVALQILAAEARAAEATADDHLAWAMRERQRRIAAEDRLDAIRKALA